MSSPLQEKAKPAKVPQKARPLIVGSSKVGGIPQSKPRPVSSPPGAQPPSHVPPPSTSQRPQPPPQPPKPSPPVVPPHRPPPPFTSSRWAPPPGPPPRPPHATPGSGPVPVPPPGPRPPSFHAAGGPQQPPPSCPPPPPVSSFVGGDTFRPPPRNPAATSAGFSKNSAAAAASTGARSKASAYGGGIGQPTSESPIPIGIPDPCPAPFPQIDTRPRDHLALNEKAVATGRALKEGDYCSITRQALDELRAHLKYFMTHEVDNEPPVIMATYDRAPAPAEPESRAEVATQRDAEPLPEAETQAEFGEEGGGGGGGGGEREEGAGGEREEGPGGRREGEGDGTDQNRSAGESRTSSSSNMDAANPSESVSSSSTASSMLLHPAWIDGAMSARALLAKKRVALQKPGSKEEVPLHTIRFSQESISSQFQDGRRVTMMMEELRKKEKRVTDIPSISVVVEDGKIYSGDNRRLSVFKQTFHGHTMVPVTVGCFDQAFKRKMTSTTEGRSIRSRN